jgi:hypothetical protein
VGWGTGLTGGPCLCSGVRCSVGSAILSLVPCF